MYSLHSNSLWIFLTMVTLTEISYGIVINSFNGLTVGPGQLNGIGNDIPVSFNDLGSFVPVPASVFMKPGVLPDPIPDPDTSIDSSQYDIDELGSFQHNIGGLGSFQNNAGISLETTELAATSDIARNLATIHAYSMLHRWKLFRQQMRLWAARLQTRYRYLYSMHPYYFYRDYY